MTRVKRINIVKPWLGVRYYDRFHHITKPGKYWSAKRDAPNMFYMVPYNLEEFEKEENNFLYTTRIYRLYDNDFRSSMVSCMVGRRFELMFRYSRSELTQLAISNFHMEPQLVRRLSRHELSLRMLVIYEDFRFIIEFLDSKLGNRDCIRYIISMVLSY